MASIISASTTSGTALNMSADTTGILQLATGATPTTAVTIDTSQNVGIGTTSPTNFGSNFKMLAVQGSDFGVMQAISSSGSTTLEMMGASGVGYVGTRTNHPLVLRTNDTERMRIDSSGRITMPYQPAFCANGSSGTVTISAGSLVPFNNELFDRGNNYNPSTYTFTAPVSGFYFFMATFYVQGSSSLCFKVNGSEYGSPTPLSIVNGSDQFDTGRSMSFIVSLSANDTVSVASRSIQSSVLYTPHSNWLGYLLG